MNDKSEVLCIADKTATLVQKLRRTPMPLEDVIPHIQQMNDCIARLHAECEEWRKLRDPAVLYVNLLRGIPAKLTPAQVWHLVADDRDRLAELVAECKRLQAQIDSLMLEYCPDEMSAKQMATWAEHQQCSLEDAPWLSGDDRMESSV